MQNNDGTMVKHQIWNMESGEKSIKNIMPKKKTHQDRKSRKLSRAEKRLSEGKGCERQTSCKQKLSRNEDWILFSELPGLYDGEIHDQNDFEGNKNKMNVKKHEEMRNKMRNERQDNLFFSFRVFVDDLSTWIASSTC
jgi:hypothetical protein